LILLVKAKSWEITCLHMEKGPLTRMEELSTQEKEKEKELWIMCKFFQYQKQMFLDSELEIYNDRLKKDKILLQCTDYQTIFDPYAQY
jgi:hypothetical protein